MDTVSQLSRCMCAETNVRSENNRAACMHSLPPVGAVLSTDSKLVREVRASRDRALSDTSRPIHPGSTVLPESVPVDSRAEGHVVLNVDDNSVSVVRLDGWAGVLACKRITQSKYHLRY
jgi:hypothetical protein